MTQKESEQLRYCLYARKSSESDERQAMSIDAQIQEMLEIAKREGLDIVEIRKESKSAKAVGQRIEFNRLLRDIEEGVFDGILTWAPDRLSRNAGDLGKLVDLMDAGKLQHIRTHGQTFSNTPNEKFLLMILCSQAKLENDNRGKNVKRGMRAKCRRGIRPGVPPLGYRLYRDGYSVRAESKIVLDEERAVFIKKIFDYVTKEKLSGRQTYKKIVADGFVTRTGKKPTLSMIYKILRESFYYGEFEYPRGSGDKYKGIHKPIITKRQFNQVQKLIQGNEKSKWGSMGFYFNRFFKCGVCGSGVCGERHTNRHGKIYTYYKCNRYGITKCKQKYIREEKLLEEVVKLIDERKDRDENLHRKVQRVVDDHNGLQREMYGEKAQLMTTLAYIQSVLKSKNYRAKKTMLECLEGQLVLKDGAVKLC